MHLEHNNSTRQQQKERINDQLTTELVFAVRRKEIMLQHRCYLVQGYEFFHIKLYAYEHNPHAIKLEVQNIIASLDN
jgi:hypothetical protein